MLAAAGVDKSVRFHDLRHTFSTLAIQSGVDAKTVAGMLGHYTTDSIQEIHVYSGFQCFLICFTYSLRSYISTVSGCSGAVCGNLCGQKRFPPGFR